LQKELTELDNLLATIDCYKHSVELFTKNYLSNSIDDIIAKNSYSYLVEILLRKSYILRTQLTNDIKKDKNYILEILELLEKANNINPTDNYKYDEEIAFWERKL
jgi:hypothetical protein